LEALNLDGIEKHHFCPNNSKMNPDEMVNRSVKLQLRGSYITAGEGGAEGMRLAACGVQELLKDATHAGEPIITLVSPDTSRPTLLNDVELPKLKLFIEQRKEVAPDWLRDDPSPATVERWRHEDVDFEFLEQKFQRMRAHIRRINLYSVIITKCPDASLVANPDPCRYCLDTNGWRGTYRPSLVFGQAVACEVGVCDEDPDCVHKISAEIEQIQADFDTITPANLRPPRKCSMCRNVGHDRRTCPQRTHESAV
jgi:hypothetical protein